MVIIMVNLTVILTVIFVQGHKLLCIMHPLFRFVEIRFSESSSFNILCSLIDIGSYYNTNCYITCIYGMELLMVLWTSSYSTSLAQAPRLVLNVRNEFRYSVGISEFVLVWIKCIKQHILINQITHWPTYQVQYSSLGCRLFSYCWRLLLNLTENLLQPSYNLKVSFGMYSQFRTFNVKHSHFLNVTFMIQNIVHVVR